MAHQVNLFTFTTMSTPHFILAVFLLLFFSACTPKEEAQIADVTAFTGAKIIDGTGQPPIERSVLLIQDGRVLAVGKLDEIEIPAQATIIDISGKTLMPGIINTHGHVGNVKGLESGHYSTENVLDQLSLYARYGVTTVVSLGDDRQEAIAIRDAQDTSSLTRARLYFAGEVVTGDTPEEAVAMVDENVAMPADFIKIRVDDNLGTTTKMSPEVYLAVIDHSHELGLPVATHMYYLEDAKALLEAGSDFIAHSVRDQKVDEELIGLLKENDVCYCPTLTRDLSTFVYEEAPDFFSDPFFRKEVDDSIINQLKDPERQAQIKESRSAQIYKQALDTALMNLKILADHNVTIAFGTDSGPPARFQGYFEHLEMEMMAEAGLSPMQIIVAATGDAASCMGLEEVGTLESGKWADFIILEEDPQADISHTQSIVSVWIAGNKVPDAGQ